MGNYGEQIAEKRKEARLTQAGLAAMLGVSGMAVSKWERGLALPCPEHREQLVNLLGLSVDSNTDDCENDVAAAVVDERKITFFSTLRQEALRIPSAGVILGICVCRLLGLVGVDTTIVCIGICGTLFCLGTMLISARRSN